MKAFWLGPCWHSTRSRPVRNRASWRIRARNRASWRSSSAPTATQSRHSPMLPLSRDRYSATGAWWRKQSLHSSRARLRRAKCPSELLGHQRQRDALTGPGPQACLRSSAPHASQHGHCPSAPPGCLPPPRELRPPAGLARAAQPVGTQADPPRQPLADCENGSCLGRTASEAWAHPLGLGDGLRLIFRQPPRAEPLRAGGHIGLLRAGKEPARFAEGA